MSDEMSSGGGNGQARPLSPAAVLFQKAHQKMQLLTRVDEQVAQLMDRRRSLQQELRDVQTEINEEFERALRAAAEPPAGLVATLHLSVPADADETDAADEPQPAAAAPATGNGRPAGSRSGNGRFASAPIGAAAAVD